VAVSQKWKNGANTGEYQQRNGAVQVSQEQIRCLHQATGETE